MPTNATPLSFDFADAPGGDLSLDDIFNIGETQNTAPPTPTPAVTDPAPEPETFLKNATGTVVYKTADDAIKGIEHKDALISELRQKVAEQTGKDPLKAAKETPGETSYYANPKQYFEDIKKASSEEELLKVQSRFVQETIQPYAPIIAGMAKSQAIEQASADIPEIPTFLRSAEYQAALEASPLLKQAIFVAETNPQAAVDLGQLYKLAYTSAAGMNVSKIVKETRGREAPVEARPTVASTTVTPPNSATRIAPPSLYTKEGRQAIMEQERARGVEDIRF